MSSLSSNSQLTEAARLTVAFTVLYSLTMVNILVTKRRQVCAKDDVINSKRQTTTTTAADRNYDTTTTFDRYHSPQMHVADRLQGNFLEWSPIFFGLVWSLAARQQLTQSCVGAAWTYLALRMLYMVLILRYGVDRGGRNIKLWPATMPGYLCLLYLGQYAIRNLFFH